MLELLAEFVAELAVEASFDLELAFISPYLHGCAKQIRQANEALRGRDDVLWQWVEPEKFQRLRTQAPSQESAAILVGTAQVVENLSRAVALVPPEAEHAAYGHLTAAAASALHAGNSALTALYSPWVLGEDC